MRDALAAPFEAKEVRQFTKEWTTKAGEKKSAGPFDFIEDETVMDRLDDVVGIGNWYVHAGPVGDTCVRVVLGVRFDKDAAFVEYEDFGYATRADSPEPFKEAVSDGIRRCGRYVGIARYLYRKHDAADIVASKKLAANQSAARGDGLVGIARLGDRTTSDGEIRESIIGPDGEELDESMPKLGFRLMPREGDRGAILVEAWDALATALVVMRDQWVDQPVTAWGVLKERSFPKGKSTVKYHALVLSRIHTPTFTIPALEGEPGQAPQAQDAAEDEPTGADSSKAASPEVPARTEAAVRDVTVEPAAKPPAPPAEQDAEDLAKWQRAHPSLALIPDDAA